MTPDYYNQALALTGSTYRVPPQEQVGRAQAMGRGNVAEAVQQTRAQGGQKSDGQDKAWGLINMAANMYTGGAFGAVTGGVGKKSDGSVGLGIQGDGGGGAAGAAAGIAGAAGGSGGWQAKPVNAADYSQYELGNRTGGPIFGGG